MILVDHQIHSLCKGIVPSRVADMCAYIGYDLPAKIEPLANPFDPDLVNPASLDIRIGKTAKLRREAAKDGYFDIEFSESVNEVYPYWFHPGDRLLVASLETINLPPFLTAQFKLKSSRGREWYGHQFAGFCIGGNTMIPLLDGTTKPIKDLVGTSQWVYSLNDVGDVVPGRATNIRKTKSVNQLIRVWLDNGKYIETTPEHRYMLRDGSYAESSSLSVGQSLMPFYRKHYCDGRERVMCPGTKLKSNWKKLRGKFEPTHRLVAKQIFGNVSGRCVHHIDQDINNNCPENLTLMSKYSHDYLHRVEYNKSEQGRENARKNMKNSLSKVKDKISLDPEYAEKIKLSRSKAAKIRNEKYWSNPENKIKQSEKLKQCANIDGAKKWIEANKNEFNGRVSQGIQSSKRNHKIVKIERIDLAIPVDVYDMTVNEFHNFATDEGVFLHNCDPGWNGSKLTMELVNDDIAPLPIYPGLRIGQLIFSLTLGIPEKCYAKTGRYNNDTVVKGSKG